MSTTIWKTFTSSVALGLVSLLFAAPLSAQDTAAGEGTDVNELSMGQVVGAERAPGTTYVDEVFNDWERRCTVNPEGADPCHLYQLLKDGAGQPIAEINVLTLPPGLEAAAGITIIAPLETLLTQQLTIGIDSHPAKRYPFKFCATVGCVSQIGLTAEEVAAYKRGAEARIMIVPAGAPDNQVVLNLSLTGFTAGFDSLPVPEIN